MKGLASLLLPLVSAVGPGTWGFTPPATPVAHHAPAPHHYGYTLAHAAPVAHHAVHHAAPAHHAAHHGVAHHAVAHHAVVHAPVHHAYHAPKHNCSVVDVVESAEVCTPAFETVCETIEVPTKKIIDVEQCYPVTRTVCSESVEVIDNEICVYSYSQKVTVCQPTPGYGYHQYGHNYCKEVAQETCYNVPVVTEDIQDVEVAFPEPIEECVQKPIDLTRISCEDLTEEKCITVPEVMDDIELEEKCITQLAAPACQTVELTLPKQVCKEINYGYAENVHEVEPVTYAPAPAYAAPEPVVPAYAAAAPAAETT